MSVYTLVIPGMADVFLAAMTRNPLVLCSRVDSRVRGNDANRSPQVSSRETEET